MSGPPRLWSSTMPSWPRLAPPKVFEYGELPIFVLVLLRSIGPLPRASLEKRCFGSTVEARERRRVDGALQGLLKKNLIGKKGECRSFQYVATPAGLRAIRPIPPPALSPREASALRRPERRKG